MAVNFWIGGESGNWSSRGNWSSGKVPKNGDTDIDRNGLITATNLGSINGIIWLDYVGSLPVGLSLFNTDIAKAASLLITASNGPVNVGLNNASLNGTTFVGSGTANFIIGFNTAGVNKGWFGVANTLYQTTANIIDNGTFQNSGTIQAGTNATFQTIFGWNGFYQYEINTGTLQADPGGVIDLEVRDDSLGGLQGSVVNSGRIIANGGEVHIDANFQQTGAGKTMVTNNGVLTVTGHSDGGTIEIKSGMLDFGHEELGGKNPGTFMHSKIDFTGTSGAIGFGTPEISDIFNEVTKTLTIVAPWRPGGVEIAHIQLGSAHAYSAANFDTSGGILMYHAT